MHTELPFSKQNRPWLTEECIDAMNEQFVVCLVLSVNSFV